ncbi:DUF6233 domain-containing protein [Streptomyces rubiginosohelvolus]
MAGRLPRPPDRRGRNDLPPDQVRLRTLETWAAHYLTRIRARIAAVERQQSQQQPLGPGGGRYRGPHHGDHLGDCWARGNTLVAVSAERARAELAGGAQPCAVCRPDRVLNRPP